MYVLQSYRFAVFAEQWIKKDAFLLVLSEITVMDIINVTNTLNLCLDSEDDTSSELRADIEVKYFKIR